MWVLKWCVTFIFTITVTTSLDSPYNVTMKAVNTRYILMWDWDQTQANYTMKFTSAYTYSNNKHIEELYRTVCNRTAKRQCDFSHQNLFYSASYVLRVRAEGKRESSRWSFLRFCPDEQASLGPPSRVEVQSGETTLKIILTEPLTIYNTSMSAILSLSYRVQYWEKHNPQRNGTMELNVKQGTLKALKPRTDYCLRSCAFNLEYEKTSPYTSTQCVRTGSRDHSPGWYIILFLFCVALPMCLIFWRRDKIRSFFLCPTVPSSIRDPPPSAMCALLEPREESFAALVVVAVQELQCPPGDRRAELAWSQQQDSSGQDSGISSGTSSDGISSGTSSGISSATSSGGISSGTSSDGISFGTSSGISSGNSSDGISSGISSGTSSGISSTTSSDGISSGTSSDGISFGTSSGISSGISSDVISSGTSSGISSGISSDGIRSGTSSDGITPGSALWGRVMGVARNCVKNPAEPPALSVDQRDSRERPKQHC